MIPVTYPSSVSTSKESQMVVFALSSVAGLQRWTDYIPVKYQSTGSDVANSFNTNGYIACDFLVTTTGKQAWIDYIPVYVDTAATTAWQVSDTGFIPFNTLAGGGAYGIFLDFTAATTLDPRITFSRTSNATLTDSTGKIAYAPHNLLTNSEDFEASAWTKTALGVATTPAVTANFGVAPDGTTTADRIQFGLNGGTTSTDRSFISQAFTYVANTSYTVSIYLRSLSGTVAMGIAADSLAGNQPITVTTEWQRFTFTATTTTGGAGSVLLQLRGGQTPTQANTADVLVWGAQLNVANAPVNLLTFSEQFDNVVWQKLAAGTAVVPVVTANYATAPDGTLTADRIVFDRGTGTTGSDISYINQSITSVPSDCTGSIWLRTTDGSTKSISFRVGNTFNYTANVTGTWTRFTLTGTAPITRVDLLAYGNASVQVTDLLVWGAQLNTGSTALPYVATTSSIYLPPSYNSTTPKNLLGFTQEFDNAAWVKAGTTTTVVTPNTQVAPDGYLTADTITFGGTQPGSNRIYQDSATNSVNGTSYTASVWLRAPSSRPIEIAIERPGPADTEFTVVTVTTEWQRFTFTHSPTWTGSGALRLRLSTTTVAGDFYAWGAQLSNSASVDPYVYNPQAAPTSTAYFGPRFDYSPTTLAANGLLIEQQSTNLFTYSEQLDDASWTKLGGSITANATTDPSGANGADRLTEDTSTGLHIVYRSVSVTSGTTYTMSYWAKRGSGTRNLSIRMDNGTSTLRSTVDLATGVITPNASHTVTARAWGSYWYVTCAVTATASTFVVMGAEITTTGGLVTYTGDGTSSLDLWGFQLEAGSFATSYIPTVASQVTRAADNASMLGDNFATWYRQDQGTFNVNADTLYSNAADLGTIRAVFTADDGTTSNLHRVYHYANKYGGNTVVAGANQSDIALSAVAANTPAKVAYAYAVNSFNAAMNGVLGTLDTSGALPAPNRLSFGVLWSVNGHIRSFSYYPTALPSTTLQAITA